MRDKSINKEKKKNSYEKHVNKFLRDIDLSHLSTEQHQKAVHLIAEVSDRILPQHWQFWRCTKFQDKNYAGQMKHQCISIFLPWLNHCMKKSNIMLGTFLIKDR